MKKTFFFLLIFFLVSACQATKDAFTLKKKTSRDEFLVEKKSPLVLPPEFGKLPAPGFEEIESDKDESSEEILSILTKEDNTQSTVETNSETTSIEKLILEKIK